MAESLLIAECAAMYSAVSKGDHESMVVIYAHAIKKAVMAYSQQRRVWRGFGRGGGAGGGGDGAFHHPSGISGNHSNSASNDNVPDSHSEDEKIDEYFHHPKNPYLSASPTQPQCNHQLIQELDSILQSHHKINDKHYGQQSHEQPPPCASSSSSPPSSPLDTKWQSYPHRRRKSNKTAAYSLSLEEDECMRIAAKALSNSRPPPSFVLYPEDVTPAATDAAASGATNDDPSHPTSHSGPPLFDGSTAGMSHGTLLHLACIVDAPFCLAILLAMGGDPSGRHSTFRRLPIHEAACSGSINCLKLLLDLSSQEVEVHQPETTGVSPNSVAALHPHLSPPHPSSTLSTLHNILYLSTSLQNQSFTPLQASSHLLSTTHLPPSTHTSLLHLPTLPDGHGNTPLHWAAFKNASHCVAALLSTPHISSLDLRAQPSGWTPLHDAAYSDAGDAMRILLEKGADVDAKASSGATPLCFAAQEDAPEAARLLLEWGADTSVTCCGSGGWEQQQQGMGGGVPFVPSRFSGYTPLHYCAHYDASRTAKLLMEAGAKWDAKDLNGRMVLHVAIARGSASVLKELLKAGVGLEDDERDNGSRSHPFALLKNLVPKKPIQSSKPWNCLSQANIDECERLLDEAGGYWCPERHDLFGPVDRKAVMEVLMVGKRMEQYGVFKELWREVLSFCGRGWFEKDQHLAHQDQIFESEHEMPNEELIATLHLPTTGETSSMFVPIILNRLANAHNNGQGQQRRDDDQQGISNLSSAASDQHS